ncbi:hypothetical protein PG987_016537 [Apiospora arundinis]
MSDPSALSTEVIVSLVLEIPSLLVAGAGLVIAWLTYTRPRGPYVSSPAVQTTPSWHAHHHYHVQHPAAASSLDAGRRDSSGMTRDAGGGVLQVEAPGSSIRRRGTGENHMRYQTRGLPVLAYVFFKFEPKFHDITLLFLRNFLLSPQGAPYNAMLSEEVVVALALSVPSLLVAAISPWIAFLTYNTSRSSYSPHASRVPSWPAA